MGRLIAVEGIDGTGKGTQARRLAETLRSRGASTRLLSFPRYEHTAFGRRIGEFLNGQFGTLGDVDPLLVSLLYAGDRYESKTVLLEAIESCDVVVLDRYVASNIAHQAAKRTGNDRNDLRAWIEHLEYGVYALPQADLNVLLDLPAVRAQELIALKQQRTYTDKAADLQEADAEYLEEVRRVYLGLAEGNERWRRIDVLGNGEIRSVDQIGSEILSIVEQEFAV